MRNTLILILVAVLIVLLVVVIRPSITGFFVKDSIQIGAELKESQNYTLEVKTENYDHLKSVGLSGSLTGDGNASVYLLKGDNKILSLIEISFLVTAR